MSNEENWRSETNAEDYFVHQQKKVTLADRRPVIRTASDLVGPGIGSNTVRITDFNDLLATFNGYYSSEAGAASAPNATDEFVGMVISDAETGGRQEFTGLTSGVEYTRTFRRSPVDPEALAWTPWVERRRVPPTYDGQSERDTSVANASPTMLYMPWSALRAGDTGAFDVTESALNIRRAGVYTGVLQVGDRTSTTVVTVSFYRPQGTTTAPTTHINVNLAGTFYVPFTFIASDDAQAIYTVVQHAAGATRDIWQRLSITRIGDAA